MYFLQVKFFLLRKLDGLLHGFTWSGFSTLQSLRLNRNDKPRTSLSISNSYFWSWWIFKASSWKIEGALLDDIVILFIMSSLIGYIYDTIRCCYIADRIFFLKHILLL